MNGPVIQRYAIFYGHTAVLFRWMDGGTAKYQNMWGVVTIFEQVFINIRNLLHENKVGANDLMLGQLRGLDTDRGWNQRCISISDQFQSLLLSYFCCI